MLAATDSGKSMVFEEQHLDPLLLCSSAPLLLCSSAPLLLCSSAPLLLCSSASLLLCFFASLLLCFFASLLLCFFATRQRRSPSAPDLNLLQSTIHNPQFPRNLPP